MATEKELREMDEEMQRLRAEGWQVIEENSDESTIIIGGAGLPLEYLRSLEEEDE